MLIREIEYEESNHGRHRGLMPVILRGIFNYSLMKGRSVGLDAQRVSVELRPY
jgi:hypothetical protein